MTIRFDVKNCKISQSFNFADLFYRHESRDIIRNAVNASEQDAVIFSGHGCTGAIHKLINGLDLGTNPDLVVLVSQQEHHSNLLPWRQVNAQVVFIKETEQGQVDLEHLKEQLEHWQTPERLLVGCFPAALESVLQSKLHIWKLSRISYVFHVKISCK